jgi:hypothetical protein
MFPSPNILGDDLLENKNSLTITITIGQQQKEKKVSFDMDHNGIDNTRDSFCGNCE